MKIKIASVQTGYPVAFRHWQEVVDEADNDIETAAESEEEERVVGLWLDDPMSFQAAFDAESTPMGPGKVSSVRRLDHGHKTAAQRETNWGREFSEAQAHAQSVLSKLGNGR
jgi:hypothetical protein